MKKLLPLLLILLTGCTKTLKLNINPKSITSIVYENKEITNNDFMLVSDEINDKLLYELYDNTIKGEKLLIKTNSNDYIFEIVDKYIIYSNNNHRYFTSTNNINIILNNIVEKNN